METAIRDLTEQQEALTNDVSQLKAQMGQILEMLESINLVPPHAHPGEDSRSARILQLFEERLDALEGFKHTGFDVVHLCLFLDIAIPPNFKLPTFDKYRGTSYPWSHLTMYCRKMTPHTHDDTLLIHFFQESLTRATLRWYLGLRHEHIPTWRSLAKGFLNQYKYNMDMVPDRSQLQNMAKGEKEAFKEYARHWGELATCIQPPLSNKEMTPPTILRENGRKRVIKFCESTHQRKGESRDEEREDYARGGNLPYQ
ncbi:hypothetical protein CR513_38966, partial [Mucuna pruriens]